MTTPATGSDTPGEGALDTTAAPVDTTVDAAVDAALGAAWHDHWGRLTALLVAQFRRLDLAEEGLADAFEAAARTWPRDGVPTNPPAWLLTSARRRILDRLRAEAVAARKLPMLAVEVDLQEEAQRVMADAGEPVRDERLRLVMLCAHPTLSRENAAALTLRLVLGLSTPDIARLFLISTPTMAARLTRTRKSLADEQFEVPTGAALERRVVRAADVAYLAFTAGYAPPSGPDVVRRDLAGEGIRLARLLRDLLPGRADLDGLLALMLLQHSRRDARMRDGRLVLLPDQDRARWHADEIAEALALLTPHATAPGTPYLVQALIAAEHAISPHPDATDWPRIVARYDELVAVGDSPVVRLNRAVAVAEADGPHAGLRALDGIELPGHRLPGIRGELLARAGRTEEARIELARAVDLCDNLPERTHLQERLASLGREADPDSP